jgi:hypothetical protein
MEQEGVEGSPSSRAAARDGEDEDWTTLEVEFTVVRG